MAVTFEIKLYQGNLILELAKDSEKLSAEDTALIRELYRQFAIFLLSNKSKQIPIKPEHLDLEALLAELLTKAHNNLSKL